MYSGVSPSKGSRS